VSRIKKTQGYVIRTLDYGDTSRIVTVLSDTAGKISFIAKGARRPESRLGPALDLLNLSEFVYYNNDGLKILSQVSLIDPLMQLKSDYDRLDMSLRTARWLHRLLEDDHVEHSIFKLFEAYLNVLGQSEAAFEMFDLSLKVKTLTAMGLAPKLDCCMICGRDPAQSWFSMSKGGVVCESCHVVSDADERPIQMGTAKGLQMLLKFPFEKLGRLSISPEAIRFGTRIMDEYISYHLKPHVGEQKRST